MRHVAPSPRLWWCVERKMGPLLMAMTLLKVRYTTPIKMTVQMYIRAERNTNNLDSRLTVNLRSDVWGKEKAWRNKYQPRSAECETQMLWMRLGRDDQRGLGTPAVRRERRAGSTNVAVSSLILWNTLQSPRACLAFLTVYLDTVPIVSGKMFLSRFNVSPLAPPVLLAALTPTLPVYFWLSSISVTVPLIQE